MRVRPHYPADDRASGLRCGFGDHGQQHRPSSGADAPVLIPSCTKARSKQSRDSPDKVVGSGSSLGRIRFPASFPSRPVRRFPRKVTHGIPESLPQPGSWSGLNTRTRPGFGRGHQPLRQGDILIPCRGHPQAGFPRGMVPLQALPPPRPRHDPHHAGDREVRPVVPASAASAGRTRSRRRPAPARLA